jgi:transposase
MSRAYPAEFRNDVVAVARQRKASISQVAKDFGISEQTLHNWLKQADIEEGIRPGQKKSESENERAQRRRIKVLEQENEILRRAAAYFAKQLPPK